MLKRLLIIFSAGFGTLIPLHANTELFSFGSSSFTVDAGSTANYTQSALGVTMNTTPALGDTWYNSTMTKLVADWSSFPGFALRMSAVTNPGLSYSVTLFDGSFNIINVYDGSTVGLTSTPSLSPLSLNIPGTGDLTSVEYVQFTWGGGGSLINVQVTEFVGVPDAVTVPPPAIAVSPTSLTGFSAVRGKVSTPRTFAVSGSNLTSSVTIRAPAGYQITTSAGGPYSSSLTLAAETGTLASTGISVRLAASTVLGTRGGKLTITSGPAEHTITLAGTVTAPPPAITASRSTLTGFSAKRGKTSKPRSFSISGSNLTTQVTVRAPTGYQVSRSAARGYASSLKLSPKSGALAKTTIHVRIAANKKAKVGARNGTVTISTSGTTTRRVNLKGKVTR